MTDYILSHLEQGVMTITLNGLEVFNSFNQHMGRAFQQALNDAAKNDNVRCVVITGSGRAFCAGQDLKEVISESTQSSKSVSAPTVAVSGCLQHGPMCGQWCGRRCRRQHCARLRFWWQNAPPSSFKRLPRWAGARQRWHFWLPRLVGMARAKALTTGAPLSSAEAESMGLIHLASRKTSLTTWSIVTNAGQHAHERVGHDQKSPSCRIDQLTGRPAEPGVGIAISSS